LRTLALLLQNEEPMLGFSKRYQAIRRLTDVSKRMG